MKIRITVEDEPSERVIEVPTADTSEVKPLRVSDMLTAEVRPTCAAERRMVADYPWAATWLGWHAGQCPGYGNSPESAARALAAGRIS